MSIPIKKEINLIRQKIQEEVTFNDQIIDESLHVFNDQYEVAGLLADLTINALKYNKDTFTVNVEKYNLPIKEVCIVIHKENLSPTLSGALTKVTSFGGITIEINTIPNILVMYDEKTAYNEFKNAIAHELEHAFTTLSEYKNTGTVNDYSLLYNAVTEIMFNPTPPDDVYFFSYATYNVFGHEFNAFVSQCYGEVYDYLKKLDKVENQDIREALKKSETYRTFFINLRKLNMILDYDKKKKNNFIKSFNERSNGIYPIQDIDELDTLLDISLDRNKMAVRNCHSVAMKAYYNLFNK